MKRFQRIVIPAALTLAMLTGKVIPFAKFIFTPTAMSRRLYCQFFNKLTIE